MKKLTVFVLLLTACALSSCRYFFDKRIRGDGNISTTERSVGQFNSIQASGSITILVTQDSSRSVKIESDQNLLPYIDVINEEDLLVVKEKTGYNLRPTRDIKVHVSSPTFKEIRVSGSGDILGQNKITSNEAMHMKISGSGKVNMDINAPTVTSRISGSGSMWLKGHAKNFEAEISGSGDVHSFEMIAENTNIEISGAGSADTYASQKLDVRVSGSGTVHYKGNPSVNQRISGAGSVKKVD